MWQMAAPGSQQIKIGSLGPQPVFSVSLVEGCAAEWSLNQSESHRCRGSHFLSTPHSLPPAPASPQAQFSL